METVEELTLLNFQIMANSVNKYILENSKHDRNILRYIGIEKYISQQTAKQNKEIFRWKQIFRNSYSISNSVNIGQCPHNLTMVPGP